MQGNQNEVFCDPADASAESTHAVFIVLTIIYRISRKETAIVAQNTAVLSALCFEVVPQKTGLFVWRPPKV